MPFQSGDFKKLKGVAEGEQVSQGGAIISQVVTWGWWEAHAGKLWVPEGGNG